MSSWRFGRDAMASCWNHDAHAHAHTSGLARNKTTEARRLQLLRSEWGRGALDEYVAGLENVGRSVAHSLATSYSSRHQSSRHGADHRDDREASRRGVRSYSRPRKDRDGRSAFP